jgi:YggT family protein
MVFIFGKKCYAKRCGPSVPIILAGESMSVFFMILGGITSLYMLVIFVRIVLTWFSGNDYGRFMEILCRLTDPYLNWFRRIPGLRIGFLDLSPIVAVAVLSMLNRVFAIFSHYGFVTLGIVLAMFLQAVWSAFHFLLIFVIAVLVLRLIAYIGNMNVYNPFWRVVDTISRSVLYRICRIFFGRRIIRYLNSLIFSIAILGALTLALGFFIPKLAGFLAALPV